MLCVIVATKAAADLCGETKAVTFHMTFADWFEGHCDNQQLDHNFVQCMDTETIHAPGFS